MTGKVAEFMKIKKIEVFTNGSVNFNDFCFTLPGQVILNKKDHKNIAFTQKNKAVSNFELNKNFYKAYYKF